MKQFFIEWWITVLKFLNLYFPGPSEFYIIPALSTNYPITLCLHVEVRLQERAVFNVVQLQKKKANIIKQNKQFLALGKGSIKNHKSQYTYHRACWGLQGCVIVTHRPVLRVYDRNTCTLVIAKCWKHKLPGSHVSRDTL